MLALPETRFRAFGLHLLISLIIFLVFLGVMYFYWFPGIFMHFGGFHGITIVGGVDLVLGPFITLVIYKKTKKSIRSDLFIVFIFQISCLAVGVWLVYQQRPVLQIMGLNSIEILTLAEANTMKIPLKQTKARHNKYPKFFWLDLPMDEDAITSIELSHALTGNTLSSNYKLYKNFEDLSVEERHWRLSRIKSSSSACFYVGITSTHTTAKRACADTQIGIVNL